MSLKGKAPTAEDIAPSLPSSRTRTALESSYWGKSIFPSVSGSGLWTLVLDPSLVLNTAETLGRCKQKTKGATGDCTGSRFCLSYGERVHCSFTVHLTSGTRAFLLVSTPLLTSTQLHISIIAGHFFLCFTANQLVEMQPADPNCWKVQP